MIRCSLWTVSLTSSIIILSAIQAEQQNAMNSHSSASEAVLNKLTDPVYAPIARQLHVTGDVEVAIEVGKDGTVQSATPISGPPMLYRPALDSANHSAYLCKNCGDAGASLKLLYSFRLVPGPQDPCNPNPSAQADEKPDSHYPQVISSGNHITLIEESPPCNIDVIVIKRKRRSLKCLYLWSCARR